MHSISRLPHLEMKPTDIKNLSIEGVLTLTKEYSDLCQSLHSTVYLLNSFNVLIYRRSIAKSGGHVTSHAWSTSIIPHSIMFYTRLEIGVAIQRIFVLSHNILEMFKCDL